MWNAYRFKIQHVKKSVSPNHTSNPTTTENESSSTTSSPSLFPSVISPSSSECSSENNSHIQATRTFSCPKEGRDSWVYAMNQALLEYEKEKANARGKQSSSCMPLSPKRLRLSADSFPAAPPHQPDLYDGNPNNVNTFAPIVIHPKSPPRTTPKVFEPDIGPPLLGEAFL